MKSNLSVSHKHMLDNRKKKVVHYALEKGAQIIEGSPAFVYPTDHPGVSNKHLVQTSRVIKLYDDGSFETLNTYFIPE